MVSVCNSEYWPNRFACAWGRSVAEKYSISTGTKLFVTGCVVMIVLFPSSALDDFSHYGSLSDSDICLGKRAVAFGSTVYSYCIGPGLPGGHTPKI